RIRRAPRVGRPDDRAGGDGGDGHRWPRRTDPRRPQPGDRDGERHVPHFLDDLRERRAATGSRRGERGGVPSSRRTHDVRVIGTVHASDYPEARPNRRLAVGPIHADRGPDAPSRVPRVRLPRKPLGDPSFCSAVVETVVVSATSEAPQAIVSKDGLIALRVPAHPISRLLAKAFGPVTSTSANRHGQPAPSTCEDAREQLGDRVDLYVDWGPTLLGGES